MKIVSDYFNFVNRVKLSYQVKKCTVLDSHVYFIYSISQGRRQDFGSGGDIGQNFIHEFLSSPVLQWRRKISVLGGHSAKMYSLKNVLKFIKKICTKIYKILQK